MDIKNIETFLHVAELENFTRAAEDLSYAQSTVTSQVQQLEKELGFPLFDRIGKRVYLTQPGEKFYSYARDILHIWVRAGMLGCKDEDMTGTLHIGVIESLLMGPMPDILAEFRARYKNVKIHIKMGQAVEILSMLRQNRLDLVYISGRLNAESDLSRKYVRREPLVFFSAPFHKLAVNVRLPLSAFLNSDLITTENSGFFYSCLNDLASNHHLTMRQSITVDSTTTVAQLVMKGLGVGFMPEYSIARYLEGGQLTKLNIDVEPQYCYSQILYHRNKWIAPFVDGFVNILRENRPETDI